MRSGHAAEASKFKWLLMSTSLGDADMYELAHLRANKWRTIPAEPGVYWWYFPTSCLQRFRISELCSESALQLRRSPEGRVCLYHGMAKSLAERIEWHAAQKLSLSSLSSGFLSTFRLTLLALNDFDYVRGAAEIDAFMDGLEVQWRVFPTEAEALAAEGAELAGPFHYPLNIQNNRRTELAAFTQHLQAARKAYKERYLAESPNAHPASAEALVAAPPLAGTLGELKKPVLALVSCAKHKAEEPCPAAELYRPSASFRHAFDLAGRLAGATLILSAKHGAVRPTQILAPYDQTLIGAPQAEKARWAAMVYAQLRALPEYREARTVIWLAPNDYRLELLPLVRADGKDCVSPLEGLRQGEQRAWLMAAAAGRNEPPRPIVASALARPPRAPTIPSEPGGILASAPKADDFRRALSALKKKAAEGGSDILEITAGELHRLVGGYPGAKHRMPVCCSVMRSEMRGPDAIVAAPPKGNGASLRIAYRLPR